MKVFAAACCLLACACSASASRVSSVPRALPDPTSPAPSSAVHDPRRGSGEAVRISFGGDVHFEGVSRSALSGGLGPITPLLSKADVTMVNLETAITTRGTPEVKTYTFRAPASAFTALRRAGVDVVTMANNHGRDFGLIGLRDSLTAARAAHFPVVGIGENATQAYAPYRVTVRGQRLAFIGATQVLDQPLITSWSATDTRAGLASAKDERRLLAAVRAARATSDTVVVYLHWGQELRNCPTPDQNSLATKLIAAGADVIVGSHAHVLLGAGLRGKSFVDYGLGNFVFYARGGVASQTGVLTLTVTGRDVDSYAWFPATITGGVPKPLSGSPAASAQNSWRALRTCTGLSG